LIIYLILSLKSIYFYALPKAVAKHSVYEACLH